MLMNEVNIYAGSIDIVLSTSGCNEYSRISSNSIRYELIRRALYFHPVGRLIALIQSNEVSIYELLKKNVGYVCR